MAQSKVHQANMPSVAEYDLLSWLLTTELPVSFDLLTSPMML
jgi:hypothetical protein